MKNAVRWSFTVSRTSSNDEANNDTKHTSYLSATPLPNEKEQPRKDKYVHSNNDHLYHKTSATI